MTISNRMRAGIAVVACAAVGASGAVAGSAAAPSKTKSSTAASAAKAKVRAEHPPGRGPGGHAVHSEEVVLNEAGDAFITETEDGGAIKSISGSEVTIHEAVGTVTYKDVTITLPGSATIERNGEKATLADLKTGDDVHVSQSSDGTDVHANDDTFKPRGPGRHGPGDHHGPHHP